MILDSAESNDTENWEASPSVVSLSTFLFLNKILKQIPKRDYEKRFHNFITLLQKILKSNFIY